MKWAVLGASGFIGSRLVETLHLSGADVRPIVRQVSSLARVARFQLDWRIAALDDSAALTDAMKGCDTLVHCAVGDDSVVVHAVAPIYAAAQRAGIRRIVYLSSAAVHGLHPDPSTTEETPLPQDERLSYYRAKIRAEMEWNRARRAGTTEFVGLRPGIVFGPRSFWCADVVSRAFAGSLYLTGGGQGVCNTIYVDNLIHALLRAGEANGVDGHYFLVRDREDITWAQFYDPLLRSCGHNLGDVPLVKTPDFFPLPVDRKLINRVRQVPAIRKTLKSMPKLVKRVGKAMLRAAPAPFEVSRWKSPERPELELSEEMVGLQTCRWRIPFAKAERMLGYQPQVTFAEGMHRSIGWLQFAGYPCQTDAT
jgi:nucleoside-diphosphate-sugar epimerase